MPSKFIFWFLPVLVLTVALYQLNNWASNGIALQAALAESGVHRNSFFSERNTVLAQQDSAGILGDLKQLMPFRSPQSIQTNPSHGNSLVTKSIIRTRYKLKGTVGNQAATLEDEHGQKTIIRLGQKLNDSTAVIDISPARITLKDAHGLFYIDAEN